MLRASFIPMVVAVALISACSSEIDGKPKAQVEDVKKVEAKADAKVEAKPEAKAEAPAAAKTFKLDKASSAFGFVGAKITGDHKGSFPEVEGEVVVAGDKPTSLRVTVQTGSVTSDDERLTGHLKSADFFDVEKFPTATFTASEFAAKAGENGVTHEIGGELELHGVKKAIRFPAKVTLDAAGAKGQAEFTINRKDFGIVYPGKPDDLIKDEVLLKLDLTFKAG